MGLAVLRKKKGRNSEKLQPLEVVGAIGIEPTTPTVSRQRANSEARDRALEKLAFFPENPPDLSPNWLADSYTPEDENKAENRPKRQSDCGKLR